MRGSFCQKLKEISELLNNQFKGDNECDPNAQCTNTEGSYTCACDAGFVSTSACPDGWSEHSGHCHLWRGDQDRISKPLDIY